MSDSIELSDFKNALVAIDETIQQNKEMLCELDSHVGDGDHGITIARGTKSAQLAVAEDNPETISELFVKVGMAMIKNMGGASGPIFGSLFRGMGKAAEGKENVNVEGFHEMLEAGLDAVTNIGKAQPGQKTLVDALYPAVEILANSRTVSVSLDVALEEMVAAARTGAESTREMLAAQGRARYAGQRSIGHQDAGATSGYLILKAIKQACTNR